ncbi:MAG: T9SS type A sorting domain-containing protein [Betaproteobacteria bacterium]
MLLLLLSTVSQAGHILGGSLSYEYVGATTGIANQYKVRLSLEREYSGATFGSSTYVELKSTQCNVSVVIPVNLVSPEYLNTASGQFNCVNTNNINFQPRTLDFEGLFLIPQSCPDFKLSWENCCRPSVLGSIQSPSSTGTYIEAEINTLAAPYNSSPRFVGVPNIFQCTGVTATVAQNAFELDGDSVRYELVPARANPTTLVTYLPTRSYLQPLNSPANGPSVLDPETAMLTFTGATVQSGLFVIKAIEYRLILGQWTQIGSSLREVMVGIGTQCLVQIDELAIDVTAPGWTSSASGIPYKSLSCGDTAVQIEFDASMNCAKVSTTDVRVYTTQGALLPIKRATPACVGGLANTVLWEFHGGLAQGSYFITTGPFDGSPAVVFCSPEIDTIATLEVGPCAPPAVIACVGQSVCDTALPVWGPHQYYSTWSQTGSTGVMPHTSHWTVYHGIISGPSDKDSVSVVFNDATAWVALETRYGLCTDYDTIHVALTVDVPERPAASLTVRPNPANGEVWVEGIPPGAEVVLYNAQGQPVLRHTPTGSTVRLDIHHLARGTYWVSATSPEGAVHTRFVTQ